MIREGARVLVFSAHAADFCSRAGGTILRFVEAGGTVQVHDLTYGERCEAPALWQKNPDMDIAEVKEIRRQEFEGAAEIVGAAISCFDWSDAPLVLDRERLEVLVQSIRVFQPDIVLTHWKDDVKHPDHVETTRGVIWAVSYCGAGGIKTDAPPCPRPDLLCYETTIGTAPVSRFLPEIFVDISNVWDRKAAAIEKFQAQFNLSPAYDVLGRYRGLEAKSTAGMSDCTHAEGFVRIGTEAGG